jgi:hypothetical protein
MRAQRLREGEVKRDRERKRETTERESRGRHRGGGPELNQRFGFQSDSSHRRSHQHARDANFGAGKDAKER